MYYWLVYKSKGVRIPTVGYAIDWCNQNARWAGPLVLLLVLINLTGVLFVYPYLLFCFYSIFRVFGYVHRNRCVIGFVFSFFCFFVVFSIIFGICYGERAVLYDIYQVK